MQVGNLIRPSLSRQFIRDPSLLLYLPLYKLDGSAFQSQDAYGHLFTATNSPWGSQGRTFNGSTSVISIPYEKTLAVTTGLTIITWIKSAGGAGAYSAILSHRNVNQGYEITQNDNVSIDFQLGDGTTFTGMNARVNYSSNVWTHLACTFAQPTMKCYVDTVLDAATGTLNNPIQDLADVLWIGRRIGTGLYWNGIQGEVLIYNRCLTAGEVMQNYLATKFRYR